MFKHVLSYHKGHPNPQMYRENYVLLDGEWDFVFDGDDIGLLNEFQNNFPTDSLKIKVPYPYQSHLSGIKNRDKCDVIWYHKKIFVDDISISNIITFLSVDYKTQIYINGKYCLTHEGGYDAFSIDISPYANIGENSLVLRVEDSMHVDQFRGKQSWRKNTFTCFYPEISGITNTVYLEKINKLHIDKFSFKTNVEKKTLSIDVAYSFFDNCELKVIVIDRNENVKSEHNFKVNSKEEVYDIYFDNIHCWDSTDPFLYDIILEVYKSNNLIDKIESYFGFVSYKTKNQHIYVNDIDTYLKFVLNQGYYQDALTVCNEENIIEDLKLIKECGFNGMRMHEKVEPPLFFYYLDLMGIYVWQEVPSAYSYSYELQRKYLKQAMNQIEEHFSHPSIMCYVLFNESWGLNDIDVSEEIQEFTVDMYESVKKLSNDRLVISNDGWEHSLSDILTIHNYAETYSQLKTQYDDCFNKMYDGDNPISCDQKRLFVGNYRYQNTPIMISEFAGIAFEKNVDKKCWGYGRSVGSEDEFFSKYENLLKYIFERKDIRGFCTTQLTDVEQEVNGIFTSSRNRKISIERLNKIHEQFK